MKRILIALALFFTFIACGEQSSIDQDKYLKVYREILIARETIADSLEANKEVQDILEKYEYTLDRFAEEAMELQRNSGDFLKIVDSLRKEFRAQP